MVAPCSSSSHAWVGRGSEKCLVIDMGVLEGREDESAVLLLALPVLADTVPSPRAELVSANQQQRVANFGSFAEVGLVHTSRDRPTLARTDG